MSNAQRLPAHVIRQIAVEAGRDPRTVNNAIKRRAKPIAEADVFAAMDRLGIRLPDSDGLAAKGNG